MMTRHELLAWNRKKWESKQHAMYEKYSRNHWPWFSASLDADIERQLTGMGADSLDVLDLGTCGGSQAIELARRGHRVVATDISDTALSRAQQAAAGHPGLVVTFLNDDIASSVLADDQFDLVVDRGCYDSICSFNHDEYVASVRRVLRPAGLLLLKVMSSDETRYVSYDQVGGRDVQMPFHFTERQLRTLMSPHFTIEALRDSCYFSSTVDEPARARFAVLRNR
jgi:cyclopropane fatty-acyl-phospholipid synthase-like methyltransferase